MDYLLGIDIGTSGTKTVLFDRDGKSIASAVGEYPLYQPQIGWAEQRPEDWWNAVCITSREVLKKSGAKPSDIKGVGLSGQMHGLVILDENNQVLRKSIIWCDQRTKAECVEITERVGAERLIEITANPALTGFTASKILWVRNNEPEIYSRIKRILLPKDYIRFMLTGEFATEVSDASGMQLLDIRNRCWSEEVLDKLDIPVEWLGKMYESCENTGVVTEEASRLTGMAAGTIVAGGAGDQAAGAVGNGIVKKGIISSTIGTSGVVFAHMDEVQIDKKGRVHTFCHAVPGCWHVMGVTQGAGLSLKWFRDNFCIEEMRTAELMEKDPYILMDEEASKVEAGSGGVIFLPYMMGERTPHLDPDAKGVFFGISAAHGKAHLLRAVLEGVVYSLRDCMEIIREMGIDASQVRASGGGGKSPLWRQMQADMFNTEICTINSSEGPALGAAILAGVASGIYENVVDACEDMISVRTRQEPDLRKKPVYDRFHLIYRNLYTKLKDEYKELTEALKEAR
ncbi:MAG: xylulokinase [Clostridia bacterium]|nr:xylulokinase [Clostridia bacterium]